MQNNHLDAVGEKFRENESSGMSIGEFLMSLEAAGVIQRMEEGSEEWKSFIEQFCQPTEAEVRMQRYMQRNGR